MTVCLLANTLSYPLGGGHLWVYLNWALGLRANGCKVIWMEGVAADTPADVAAHDVNFTTGETVGCAGAAFPDGGKCWVYTPPCVALEWWPVREAAPDAPFTTISHWSEDRWLEDEQELYCNDKRTGFLPYI